MIKRRHGKMICGTCGHVWIERQDTILKWCPKKGCGGLGYPYTFKKASDESTEPSKSSHN